MLLSLPLMLLSSSSSSQSPPQREADSLFFFFPQSAIPIVCFIAFPLYKLQIRCHVLIQFFTCQCTIGSECYMTVNPFYVNYTDWVYTYAPQYFIIKCGLRLEGNNILNEWESCSRCVVIGWWEYSCKCRSVQICKSSYQNRSLSIYLVSVIYRNAVPKCRFPAWN